MTGPEHYAEAERFAELAAREDDDGRQPEAVLDLQFAQVHATLALAAYTEHIGAQLLDHLKAVAA